jgi:hypothetical protein
MSDQAPNPITVSAYSDKGPKNAFGRWLDRIGVGQGLDRVADKLIEFGESGPPPSPPKTSQQKFSQASKDGTCPQCGGTSFKAKRSGKGKFLASAGGLNLITMPLAPKSRVKCTTCGTEYKRG